MHPRIHRFARAGRVLGALILASCGDGAAEPRQETPAPNVYVPGTSYFGAGDHVEYIAGDLPVIFAAPHGGTLTPATMPPRVAGAACGAEVTTVRDANTEELVREIRASFVRSAGGNPHVVISRLHRSRLDPNRAIGEAACGNAQAEEAWRDYHGFLEVAKAAIVARHGRGWFTDVHGHGHDVQRLELGYELAASTLRRPDAELDASAAIERASSLRTFSEASPLPFTALLRGETALGTLLEGAGFPSVPSRRDPAPAAGESYFSGGYSTDRHGCSNGGTICGVQLEANMVGVRADAASRSRFAAALVPAYRTYLAQFDIVVPTLPSGRRDDARRPRPPQ
jgi:hypothetical protein